MYRAEYNLSAIVIVGFLFLIVYIRHQLMNVRMELLYAMMAGTVLSALADLAVYSIFPNMDAPVSIHVVMMVNYIGMLTYFAVPVGLFFYNYHIIYPYLKGRLNFASFYFWPYYGLAVLLTVNLYSPILYVVSDGRPVGSMPGICVIVFVVFFYLAMTITVVLRHAEQISGRKLFATLTYLIMYFVGGFLWFQYPEVMANNFIVSLVLTMVVLNLQDEREMLDEEMEVLNRGCFQEIISSRIARKQHFYLLYLYMAGLGEYLDTVSLEKRQGLFESFVDVVKHSCHERPVFRIAGEVFVVFYDSAEKQYAMKDGESFLLQIKLALVQELETGIMPHISILSYPMDLETLEDMLAAAEFMMRQLKYDPESVLPSQRIAIQKHNQKVQLGKQILEILQKNDYEICYHPIYNTKNNTILGACAKVHLRGTKNATGMNSYIAEYGRLQGFLMLEDKMFRDVCETIQKSDLISDGSAFIEVSFSDMQFMQGNFVDKVLGTLHEFGISAKRIRLCITEPVLASMNVAIEENLRALADAGIAFSLVNYGAGQSNFDRLNRFSFDTVEFDEELVNSSGFDVHEKEIILRAQREALHRFGKKIRIYTEERGLAERLSSDYTRGKAVSEEVFAAMLQKQTAIQAMEEIQQMAAAAQQGLPAAES